MSGSTSSTPSRKRKHPSYDRITEMVLAVDDDADPDTFKGVVQKLKMILKGDDEDTPSKKKKSGPPSIPASDIKDLNYAASLFGLEYDDKDEVYGWCVPEIPDVSLSPESEVLLKKMRGAKFWKLSSAEALSRTFIDIILFDRLLAHQEELAARNLILRGECRISACASDEERVVSGDADYALGYDLLIPLGPKRFESCSIIVEAKRGVTFATGLAQAVVYMAGIQQHRMSLAHPKRIVNTVYGMVSDGLNWQFLRLDGKELQISDRIRGVMEVGRHQIYRFVDSIIKAAIASTPHTTPKSRFPATKGLWQQDVESTIFGNVPRKLEDYLRMPVKEFLVDNDDDDHQVDLTGVEEFEILRPEPSRVKLLPVLPKRPESPGSPTPSRSKSDSA